MSNGLERNAAVGDRRESRRGRGYLTALLGAHLGGAILAVIGSVAGITMVTTLVPGEDLGPSIGGFMLGGLAGLWAGEAVGCWLALRLRRRPAAITTAVLLALMVGGLLTWVEIAHEPPQAEWPRRLRVLLLPAPLVARAAAVGIERIGRSRAPLAGRRRSEGPTR